MLKEKRGKSLCFVVHFPVQMNRMLLGKEGTKGTPRKRSGEMNSQDEVHSSIHCKSDFIDVNLLWVLIFFHGIYMKL